MDSVDLGDAFASRVAVLDLYEVAGSKLVALIDREAAPNLFEARRILDVKGPDWVHIKAAMLAYDAAGRRDWRCASVDDIGGDARQLRQKLAVCLPPNRFAAADGQEAWIAQPVEKCRARLARLFELTTGEAASLDGILDPGDIDPSGLAVSPDIQELIAVMPMLAW